MIGTIFKVYRLLEIASGPENKSSATKNTDISPLLRLNSLPHTNSPDSLLSADMHTKRILQLMDRVFPKNEPQRYTQGLSNSQRSIGYRNHNIYGANPSNRISNSDNLLQITDGSKVANLDF